MLEASNNVFFGSGLLTFFPFCFIYSLLVSKRPVKQFRIVFLWYLVFTREVQKIIVTASFREKSGDFPLDKQTLSANMSLFYPLYSPPYSMANKGSKVTLFVTTIL